MNSLPRVRLGLAWQCLLVHLAGALFSGLICYGFIFCRHNGPIYLLVGIGTGIFSVCCLVNLFTKEIWVVEGDKLKVESFFGNVKEEIPLTEVNSWFETPVNTWYGNWVVLTLNTSKGSLKLVTCWYSNYYPIRAILCRDSTRHPAEKVKIHEPVV